MVDQKKLALIALASIIPKIQAYGAAEPLAFAMANGIAVAEDNASYDCHASCGYAILAARECSPDGSSDSDYDESCLCSSNVQFASLVPECLSCGWCLWTDYGEFLTSALDVCSYETTPTGTDCVTQTSNWYALVGTSGETASATADSEQESAASYYASQYGNSRSASGSSSGSVSTVSDSVSSSTRNSGSSNTRTTSASTADSSSGSSASSSAAASSTASGSGSQYTIGLASVVLAFGALLI